MNPLREQRRQVIRGTPLHTMTKCYTVFFGLPYFGYLQVTRLRRKRLSHMKKTSSKWKDKVNFFSDRLTHETNVCLLWLTRPYCASGEIIQALCGCFAFKLSILCYQKERKWRLPPPLIFWATTTERSSSVLFSPPSFPCLILIYFCVLH